MPDSPEVRAEMEALKDETMADLRRGRMVPDLVPWWWDGRRENEAVTAEYVGRVLEELPAPDLAERARLGHFDDFSAPAEVADGAELIRLVAELRVLAKREPDLAERCAAVENAARRGEFDSTPEESARWEASKEGHGLMQEVAGAEGAIEEGFRKVDAAIRANMPRVGRNDPCPCGSGKKWKRCHGG